MCGSLWGCMGSLWGCMGSLWGCGGPCGDVWGPMRLYGMYCGCMGPYGRVWGPIGSQPHRIGQVGSELEGHRVQPEPNHPALNVGSCGVVGGPVGL